MLKCVRFFREALLGFGLMFFSTGKLHSDNIIAKFLGFFKFTII